MVLCINTGGATIFIIYTFRYYSRAHVFQGCAGAQLDEDYKGAVAGNASSQNLQVTNPVL